MFRISSFLPLSLLGLFALVTAQNLDVDVNWRVGTPHSSLYQQRVVLNYFVLWQKYSNSRPRSERVSIAQNAIDAMQAQLNIETGLFHGVSSLTSILSCGGLLTKDICK